MASVAAQAFLSNPNSPALLDSAGKGIGGIFQAIGRAVSDGIMAGAVLESAKRGQNINSMVNSRDGQAFYPQRRMSTFDLGMDSGEPGIVGSAELPHWLTKPVKVGWLILACIVLIAFSAYFCISAGVDTMIMSAIQTSNPGIFTNMPMQTVAGVAATLAGIIILATALCTDMYDYGKI